MLVVEDRQSVSVPRRASAQFADLFPSTAPPSRAKQPFAPWSWYEPGAPLSDESTSTGL